MSGAPGLVVRGLTRRLGGRLVVDDVSFEVPPGRVVGLLGPNGAGKTTTFRLIVGLIEPDAGELLLDGAPLTGPLHERARRGLGYLPQGSALFTGLTVRQQLLIPLEARGAPAVEADRLLEEAGLTALAQSAAAGLSGGERRRLAIARCLATRPRVLLLDEPFAGVDPVATQELVGRFRGLAAQGLGVLLTDHAAREALRACDEVVLIDQGRVLIRGPVAEVAADPRARARWLGEDF
ncbi:LPS export ABC transporter ATP-binding protein [Myxococcota bacterium]|nr:LPS export ABC transporter ATP-binding protein [Myxococcota bacterium]